jgi:hypothetical protein
MPGKRATPEELLEEIDELREILVEGPTAEEISAAHTRGRCTLHPYSWHYTGEDQPTCAQWDEDVMASNGFSELHEHPDAFVKIALKIYQRDLAAKQLEISRAVKVNGELHKHMKQWRWCAFASGLLATILTIQDIITRFGGAA